MPDPIYIKYTKYRFDHLCMQVRFSCIIPFPPYTDNYFDVFDTLSYICDHFVYELTRVSR